MLGSGLSARLILSSITSFIYQGISLGLNAVLGNSASAPQSFFTLTPYGHTLILGLIDKFAPGLGSFSLTPIIVDFLGGWIAVGSILFSLFVIFKKLLLGLIVAAILIGLMLFLGFMHIG